MSKWSIVWGIVGGFALIVIGVLTLYYFPLFGPLIALAGLFIMTFFVVCPITIEIRKKRNRRIFGICCMAVPASVLTLGIWLFIETFSIDYGLGRAITGLIAIFFSVVGIATLTPVIFAIALAEKIHKKRHNDAINHKGEDENGPKN